MINVRTKGQSGEREIGRLIEAWAAEIGITLEMIRNQDQTRAGGHDLLGIDWLAIEVKRQESLSVGAWWRQCCAQADRIGGVPFLAWRQNRKPWHFRVRLTVAHYGPVSSGVQQLDANLDEAGAKGWLQHELWYRSVV